MERKHKILIVEDEEPILKGLVDVFVYHGFEVDSAMDGKLGLEKGLSGNYDLIVLDVMLPELDGYSVCNQIRSVDREQPIVMLTAKSSEEDIIQGLTLGADDYISKPFSVTELVLRVEAVLRRSNKLLRQERYLPVGSLKIDTANLVAQSADGSELSFTRREVDILLYLQKHSDRPVPRGELLVEVWGYSKASRIETRTVDIHIAKLRRKIEPDPKQPRYLVTLRGEGYKLLQDEVA